MSQPEIVQSDLGGETVVARVDLGGEDELYITPTRTLRYRAEGLLSDESVEEFSHGAERIAVSEGRRKAKVVLDYGLDGERAISLPTSRLERALQPVVEGVLRHNGVLDGDESVAQLFRFKELTIVVAGERVVRHIGSGLWDEEFESYHYSDVTDLEFEGGSVNTSVVLTVDGQRERFKTPNEDARAVRSALESTLLSYWDVGSVEELRTATAADESGADADDPENAGEVSFGDGPDPLFADPTEPEEPPDNATRTSDDGAQAAAPDPHSETAADPEGDGIVRSGAGDAADTEKPRGHTEVERDGVSASEAGSGATAPGTVDSSTRDGAGADGAETGSDRSDATVEQASKEGFEGSGFEAAAPATDEQVLEELATLREAVARQNEELTAQRDLIEQLIEELRRGR